MHLLALFLQNQPDPAVVQKVMIAMFAIIPIVIVVCLTVVIIPFWFILKKAGFSPWLSLLYIVPGGNLFLYYFLAFANWKVVPVSQVMPPPGFRRSTRRNIPRRFRRSRPRRR